VPDTEFAKNGVFCLFLAFFEALIANKGDNIADKGDNIGNKGDNIAVGGDNIGVIVSP